MTAKAGRKWSDIFPDLRATVLQDGHVDHVTGPRCIVQISEGAQRGLYLIAHTENVLASGTDVLVNQRSGRLRATPISETGHSDLTAAVGLPTE